MPRASKGIGALLVCAARLLVSTPARAGEGEQVLELSWTAPPECPARDEVIARVDELVGGLPSTGPKVRARGQVTRATSSRPRYRLELLVAGGETNARSMSGDDCSHLVDAAALILALDIDPAALSRRAAAPPTDSPGPMPTGAVEGAPPSTTSGLEPNHRPDQAQLSELRRTEVTPSAVHLHAGIRIALDEGSLPRTTLGAAAVLALARGPLVFEIQGTLYKDQFTVAGPRGGRGGADVSLSTVSGHACFRSLLLRADWRGCVGGELGVETTRGVSVSRPETASGLWSAIAGTLTMRAFPGQPVSPAAGIALVHPLGAPAVFIEGFGTLFEPPPVVVRSFLGLDVRFF